MDGIELIPFMSRHSLYCGGNARLGFQVTSEAYSICPETGRPISHHYYKSNRPNSPDLYVRTSGTSRFSLVCR